MKKNRIGSLELNLSQFRNYVIIVFYVTTLCTACWFGIKDNILVAKIIVSCVIGSIGIYITGKFFDREIKIENMMKSELEKTEKMIDYFGKQPNITPQDIESYMNESIKVQKELSDKAYDFLKWWAPEVVAIIVVILQIWKH